MKQRIGILGSGSVGVALANGLQKLGYNVSIGSREGKKIDNWDGNTGTFEAVSADAEIVILSVKGHAAEDVVKAIKDNLSDKLVIDTCNPIADAPPENGVLAYFTKQNESLMEQLQIAVPEAHFVKAFNSVGSANMVNPQFADGKPTMFICGNDDTSKQTVSELLNQLGWEAADFGSATSARAIEPLCMLWCIPGMLHNEWTHAFKLLHRS
jgi:predicted dinucleotide-binding enzyme